MKVESESNGRVVWQLQMRLLDIPHAEPSAMPLAEQISTVRQRVAGLQRLGAAYAGVRVSRHVSRLRDRATVKCARVSGAYTEV